MWESRATRSLRFRLSEGRRGLDFIRRRLAPRARSLNFRQRSTLVTTRTYSSAHAGVRIVSLARGARKNEPAGEIYLEAGCATKTRLRASLFVAQLSGGAATSDGYRDGGEDIHCRPAVGAHWRRYAASPLSSRRRLSLFEAARVDGC